MTEREQCKFQILAINVARAVQVTKLARMPWDEISNNMTTLDIASIDVPEVLKQLAFVRKASTELKAGAIEAWLDVVDPTLADWDWAEPSFGACWLSW